MLRRRAFTLVEMLITIGIILLLISILLPALNTVREQARMTRCASNIRGLLSICTAYAAANDQKLPIPALAGEIGQPGPPYPPYLWWCPSPGGICDYQNGTIWRYFASVGDRQQAWNCPDDMEDFRPVTSAANVSARNFSYSLNVQLRGATPATLSTPPAFPPGIKAYSILNSSHKIMIVEEAWPNDCVFDYIGGGSPATPSGVATDVPSDRHAGKCNMGMADGHVEQFYPNDLGYNTPYAIAHGSGVYDTATQSQIQTYFSLFTP